MTYVTVPALSAITPHSVAGNTASQMAAEKFADAKLYAGEAFTSADGYLEILSALFAGAAMPDVDISYAFQQSVLDAEIESKRPVEPTDDELTPTLPTLPSLGAIEGVVIPSVDLPVDDTGELVAAFNFDEAAYISALLAAVKVKLLAFVEDGGTGLGADVEAAIWARAQARQDIVNEKTYNEALNYFAAKGFTIPPGALAGRITEALAEQTRANAQLNYEIMIEQAKLAQDMTKHTLTISVQLEGVEKQFASSVATRALDKAKTAVTVIVDVYNAKVAAYAARSETARTQAQVAEITANVQIATNLNTVEIYRAGMDAYKAQVVAELGIIESVAKVYGYKIAGYEADAKVAVAVLEAQISKFEAEVTQANNQTTLSLKEAELTLNSYLGALAIQEKAAEGSASIAAQLAASALNSVNASTSLGYNVGLSRSDGVTARQAVSNAASLQERHTYIHEA